jgi:hypothetical protein
LRRAAHPGTILIANGAGLDDHIVQSLRKINSNLHLIQCANAAPELDAHQFISPAMALFMAKKMAFVGSFSYNCWSSEYFYRHCT